MTDPNKDLARYVLNRTFVNGKIQAKKKGAGTPRFPVICKIASRERKKARQAKLGRQLAVILPEPERVNELFQDWLALGKTKNSFAEYVKRRLTREGCA